MQKSQVEAKRDDVLSYEITSSVSFDIKMFNALKTLRINQNWLYVPPRDLRSIASDTHQEFEMQTNE